MPPRRSSSRSHQLAQRRSRTGKACHFCRITKQRCDSTEFGTNNRPCRRCVSQGLNCEEFQAAHSQSPSSGLGAQGSGPVRHRITPRSAGGATEELTASPPFMMHADEQQGSSSTVLAPGQTQLQTQNFFHPVHSMEGYPQSFPNVVQGSANLGSIYYPQDYYGQTTSGDTYMANYATQGASDGAPDLGYAMEEPQPDNEGAFVDEDANYFRSDEF